MDSTDGFPPGLTRTKNFLRSVPPFDAIEPKTTKAITPLA
jgi:hypothetical protein